MRALPVLAALLFTAAPALAQAPMPVPGAPETARVKAGSYTVEPGHTQVTFAIDHMGFSLFRGDFSQASGTLTLDPANPTGAKLSVTIPIASVHTTSDKLDEELISPDWFDAGKFPTATFTSTTVELGPNNLARVQGMLTLHGVTKPETLLVHFHGAGTDPLSKAPTIGFDGRMSLKRSDFGVTKYVPLVSDRVELTIAAAFVRG